jgi:hypothetical protein
MQEHVTQYIKRTCARSPSLSGSGYEHDLPDSYNFGRITNMYTKYMALRTKPAAKC